MSSLEFDYLHYPLRLYYNSLLNVIQSLVFYPPPSSRKSFLPHQYFGTFPVISILFFKIIFGKNDRSFIVVIIDSKKELWTSQYSTYSFYKRVTNGVLCVRKNLFWRIIPPLFFDKRFSWLWKTFRRRPYSFWIRIQKVLIFWNHKWQNRKSYS